MMQNTEEVSSFSMKLTDHDLQFTFFWLSFHLCSGVTLHWRLTSRICNDRPELFFFVCFFFNVFDQTCLSLSLPLSLPKSHQRNTHKWGRGVQTDTHVLFIRIHFPPSFPGLKTPEGVHASWTSSHPVRSHVLRRRLCGVAAESRRCSLAAKNNRPKQNSAPASLRNKNNKTLHN